MTYRGHIKNGVVVFDDSVLLPEGVEVTISVAPAKVSSHSWEEVQSKMTGGWDPGERERLLDELKQMKADDLQREIDLGKWD